MATIVLSGKIISKTWCEFHLALTPASRKTLKKHQAKFESPIKQDLLKLKPSRYTHGRENLVVDTDVSVTVKISYYKFATDPEFATVTNEGLSLQPILPAR